MTTPESDRHAGFEGSIEAQDKLLISAKIKELRTQLGSALGVNYTQLMLANSIGVNPSSVHRWESPATMQLPSINNLFSMFRLAMSHNVPFTIDPV